MTRQVHITNSRVLVLKDHTKKLLEPIKVTHILYLLHLEYITVTNNIGSESNTTIYLKRFFEVLTILFIVLYPRKEVIRCLRQSNVLLDHS